MKRCIFFVLCFLVCALSVSHIGGNVFASTKTFLYGDVDMDGVVTVKDATLIQKDVAGLSLLSATQKYIVGSANPTVKNATEVQKFVAELNVKSTLIGKEIEKSKYGSFTENVNTDSNFDDASVIVLPKEGFKHIYTLSDFSEFDFVSITPIGECYDGQYLGYTLYIDTPSKSNVLEAIKALEYRGNYDLEAVHPNYIFSYN